MEEKCEINCDTQRVQGQVDSVSMDRASGSKRTRDAKSSLGRLQSDRNDATCAKGSSLSEGVEQAKHLFADPESPHRASFVHGNCPIIIIMATLKPTSTVAQACSRRSSGNFPSLSSPLHPLPSAPFAGQLASSSAVYHSHLFVLLYCIARQLLLARCISELYKLRIAALSLLIASQPSSRAAR
jgi:hypothetical protein